MFHHGMYIGCLNQHRIALSSQHLSTAQPLVLSTGENKNNAADLNTLCAVFVICTFVTTAKTSAKSQADRRSHLVKANNTKKMVKDGTEQ